MSRDRTTKKNRKQSTSENHMKAPICAAFVEAMRDAFGAENVKVIYVKEGEVEIGEPSDPKT